MDSHPSAPSPLVLPVDLAGLGGVLDDLGLRQEAATVPGSGVLPGQLPALVVGLSPAARPDPITGGELRRLFDEALSPSGTLLLLLSGERSERELASWRNAIWPLLHTNVLYRLKPAGTWRRTLSGEFRLEPCPAGPPSPAAGTILVARRRAHALSPDATVEKFDQNAGGWNGVPGAPGYPHFRWMRRFVGCFAPIAARARILDFGSGAGWCGIEAARRYGASELAFFDPSPEMVRIAQSNAEAAGIRRPVGRTGFGEAPPFPAAGEDPFDAVISSGVVSFSPDPGSWFDGLTRSVRPRGLLVVGDIHRDSRGNRRRRALKPLLPAREMNALTPAEVRAALESRGFRWVAGAGYQLTRPFPEAMHVNETRLRGLLTHPLLWSNQLGAAASRSFGLPGQDQFDSWVMSFVRDA